MKNGREWVIVNTHGESFNLAQKGKTLRTQRIASGAQAIKKADDEREAICRPPATTGAFCPGIQEKSDKSRSCMCAIEKHYSHNRPLLKRSIPHHFTVLPGRKDAVRD